MKKILCLVLISLVLPVGYASKLSKYLHKVEEENRMQQEREWQQDMDFRDFSFRLERRYMDDHGQRCREYVFRARSNPYRHGYFTVCDER